MNTTSRWICGALMLVFFTGNQETIAQENQHCNSDLSTTISLVQPWQGNLDVNEAHCFKLQLRDGDFVRTVVELVATDLEVLAGFSIYIHQAGDNSTLFQTGVSTATFTRQPLSWEAASDSLFFIELRDFYLWPETVSEVPVQIRIESVETAAQVKVREEALSLDARADWLRENATPIRSINPDDTDFSDLEFLHEVLQDVRVVMLGEADHNAGTDFLARSRLVKFLHGELDFDVLAFEAPLYGMDVAWDSIKAGAPIREAFNIGNWGFWTHAEQMQPLVDYIGEQAAGDHPLELAGFDFRPWLHPWTRNTSPQFAEDLQHFMQEQAMSGALANEGSPEYKILEVLSAQRNFDEPPGPEKQADFLQTIDETVSELKKLTNSKGKFWAEALRGVGCFARKYERFDDEIKPECHRDTQMGKHLLWLAEERYPDRKIIVWAGTAHIMRDPDFTDAGMSGPAMGKVVWNALGEESYSIGMTSYQGENNFIISDQHLLPEFEQLMNAAGFEYGLVDLRDAAREGNWLSIPFLARPISHHTENRTWSDKLDALFFVKEQERRRQVGK